MTQTRLLLAVIAFMFAAKPALAQQVTGTLGSPSATTTIDGKHLPPPDPAFGGIIKNEALQSTPWWPPGRAAQGCAKRLAHHYR